MSGLGIAKKGFNLAKKYFKKRMKDPSYQIGLTEVFESGLKTGKYARKNPGTAGSAVATGTLIARSLHKDKKGKK